MERYFKITKESQLSSDIVKYSDMLKVQKLFINNFFSEFGIQSAEYYICGTGEYDIPFKNCQKSRIRLYINPTESDKKKIWKYTQEAYKIRHARI